MTAPAAATAIPKGIELPDGWTVEWIGHTQTFLVIIAPGRSGGSVTGGLVTIDLGARGFRYGWSSSGPMHSERTTRGAHRYGGRVYRGALRAQTPAKPYEGRGWKLRLFTDALAWLMGVAKE